MTTSLAASVIIPTRGGRDRLHFPLDALRRQNRQDFEVVVVVDGDVDDTRSLLEQYRADGMENLRWVVFPENRGRSQALNAGYSTARGEVLIRCDDDLEPGPDYVDLHVTSQAEDRASGVIGMCDNLFPPTPYAEAYGNEINADFHRTAYATPADRRWKYWGGNVSMNRRAYELVRGYDTDYKKYGWEDVDMGYRLHCAGAPIVIEPGLTTPHHVAATTTEIRALRALHSGAARDIFVRKHGEESLGGPTRPGGLWGLAVRALATVMTEPVVRGLSRGVDRVIPRCPAAVSRKLVALCVESASRSGILHPDRARSRF